MSYQVLARSWRPQHFADLLGQDAVVQTLRNALTSGTLGQAYLFTGIRGVGKTTAARLLAKAVNCAEGPTATPCGECDSCREIAAGASVDVVELDAATHTGVDDVRDLQELLRYRPIRDRRRVIIVDEVHMLSKAAFNALLKSIEEPPEYVLWIFATTERHKVPATILSRCQQLEFRPVATELIAAHLRTIAEREEIDLDAPAAAMIARVAGGSFRDALSLLDQLRAFSGDRVSEEAVASILGLPRMEQTAALLEALLRGDAEAGLGALRSQLVAGHDATMLYQELGRALRILLHLAVDRSLAPDLGDDMAARLEPTARELGVGPLVRMLGLWLEQESLLREASNRELALEVACLRLARWPAVRNIEILLGEGGPAAGSSSSSSGSARGAKNTGDGGRTARPPRKAPAEAGPAPREDHPEVLLAETLWPSSPQLAAAVEAAEAAVEGDRLILRFAGAAAPLGRFVAQEGSRRRLEEAAAALALPIDGVVVVHDAEAVSAAPPDALEREAAGDAGLQAAVRILGGEVVAVRADRNRPADDGEASWPT